jgi:hypothetical protein
MECVFAWHFYYSAVATRLQFFVRDVSDDGQTHAAVRLRISVLQNVFFYQLAHRLLRGRRRSISVWVVFHYVLNYVLNVLLLTTHEHLENAQRQPIDLDGPLW